MFIASGRLLVLLNLKLFYVEESIKDTQAVVKPFIAEYIQISYQSIKFTSGKIRLV